jgi:4-diphosphocytidyl-2-C-methyl-D-erythritol kinase
MTEAVRVMEEYTGMKFSGYTFTIEKNIPMGGGLGGGSSNGAAVMKLINRLFSLGIGTKTMTRLAADIGSDVPFFIRGGTARVFGRGEIVSTAQWRPIKVLLILVLPGLHVSTPEAYADMDAAGGCGFRPSKRRIMRRLWSALHHQDYGEMVSCIYNRFEETVVTKYPKLEELKQSLHYLGADCAFMSGSGSTMVGIYPDIVARDSALSALESDGVCAIAATTR